MIEVLKGIHEIVNYQGDFRIRVYLNKEYEDFPQHWHTDAEIIMPIENNYKVIVDDMVCELKEGEIMILPPGELHQLYAPPTGVRIIMQFDCSLLNNMNGFNSAFHMFRPYVTVIPSAMPAIHKELSSLLLEITSEYFSTLPFREASVYSMLIRFFTILGRNYISMNEKFPMKKNKQNEYINLFFNVCNFMNDHCTENITIDDISKTAGFSKYHFARLFKQVMNVSWYDYLMNRRILHAEKLLVEPDLSIMQVAMKSGFSSLATFNRLFKEKNRCTPTEYKSLFEIRKNVVNS